MTSLLSTQLQSYLETQCNYKIVGVVDIDDLVQRPRKTLYQLFKNWYKPVFETHEKIVFYSRNQIADDVLIHIQKCASLLDISNFFILVCSPKIDQDRLDTIRKLYSVDECTFTTLEVDITDTIDTTKKYLLNLPDSFCFSPWAHLEISSVGEFKPCCVFKESIHDSQGKPYNINTHNIELVYHSEYLQNIRTQFINGEKPDGCSNCWFKEQHSVRSNRQWIESNLGLAAHTLEIESNTIENLISLDIKLGNLCNFKCRICTPSASSKVAEERQRHFGSTYNIRDINKNGQWANNPDIWNTLRQIGNQLVNIDFFGGEPFLIKQHKIFLDYLIEHNYSKNIRLHYNTNGSIYPAGLFDKWQQFKQVDIAFSIDNIEERFEFERGGSWVQVESNLDKFLQNKLPNMTLGVFTTVNIQNIYYLDQLINWYETKTFNTMMFNLLEDPRFLSIKSMNKELVDLVTAKLQQIDSEKISRYNLGMFIQRLKQKTIFPESIDQLKKYMLKLDSIRNQNFALSHPEIANIIYKGN